MKAGKAIVASGLTKYYGDFLAVDHIDFEVEEGEIFGFLGPNGAGKTTTVRMLTGVSTPSEGSATIMGFDIIRQSVEAKSVIGVVPDISNVYDELSAWENLIFTGKLYGIPKAKREGRASELLRIFNLYERRGEKVRGFSRGMKRKVCIAMALMNDSKVLFLDEPTSGLDVDSVREIRRLMRDLNKDGLTIFLTTHNLEEANQICDRIAIINRGRIVAIDTPERLRQITREVQSVEVAFRNASREVEEGLKALRGVTSLQKLGDKYRLYTSDPSEVLDEIFTYSKRMNLVPISINTLGPTLEDVFLRLTGREMEKEAQRELGIERGRMHR
jgi:ABC-2 type transport system ATP-binding protein